MKIERFDLRLEDGKKAPDGVLVYSDNFDVHEGLFLNERRVMIGAATYGDRYDSFRLTVAAQRRYDEAVRTVRWFDEMLRCRISQEELGNYDEFMEGART